MTLKKVLVVYARPYNKEQRASLDTVRKALKKNKIKTQYCERTELKENFLKFDLCVVVGGDGTFLRAAQFAKGPIVGMNSDTETKEGVYMKLNKKNFEKKFKEINKGNFKTTKLLRLCAKINGKLINCLALNEFYFGAEKAYMTSRYKIEVGKNEEVQRSSGVIIATPTGTRAWAKAIGAKVLPENFEGFGFVVREPFEHKVYSGYKLNHGVLRKGQTIKLKSQMNKGVMVADSVSREYKIKYGDVVEIGVSNNSMNIIVISEKKFTL